MVGRECVFFHQQDLGDQDGRRRTNEADGIHALRDIRSKDPAAKIVVILAVEQRRPLMDALRWGAVDYLTKPFEKERVAEAMSRVKPVGSV
ncbi:MAG: response regulator [Planctomycetota bacterium]|nr:response regulator [Planctomycetota bacterium]